MFCKKCSEFTIWGRIKQSNFGLEKVRVIADFFVYDKSSIIKKYYFTEMDFFINLYGEISFLA